MSTTRLGVDEVHLWHRLTEPTGGRVHEFEEHVLSPEEYARRDRYRFDPDRRDYAVAHDLLRRSLSRYGDTPPHAWRFGVGTNGKPFVSDGGLSFNLSHTRGLVACGIARAMPVGIDVERIDRQMQTATLAERFFSAPEAASLSRGSTDARHRFFDLWTLKEAFVKAIDTGLSQPLNRSHSTWIETIGASASSRQDSMRPSGSSHCTPRSQTRDSRLRYTLTASGRCAGTPARFGRTGSAGSSRSERRPGEQRTGIDRPPIIVTNCGMFEEAMPTGHRCESVGPSRSQIAGPSIF